MFGNKVMDMMFAPWPAYSLYCAGRLKVFNFLVEEGSPLEELAEKTGAAPRLLSALLDACIVMGLVQKKDHRYVNTTLGHTYLVEGEPRYLGDMMEVLAAEAGSWNGLYDVMTGKNLNGWEHGDDITPHRFTMAMNNLASMGEADALADRVDLDGRRNMVDVGCGSGIYSIMLCRKFPGLHAVLLDREEVLKTTDKMIRNHQLQDRIVTVGADIGKDSYGVNKDVVLLSDVLYQEGAACLEILRSAYRALSPGGRLIVRGYYTGGEGAQPESAFSIFFNLHQLLDDPRRKIISVSLLRNWVEQVGFNDIETSPLTERSHLLVCNK